MCLSWFLVFDPRWAPLTSKGGSHLNSFHLKHTHLNNISTQYLGQSWAHSYFHCASRLLCHCSLKELLISFSEIFHHHWSIKVNSKKKKEKTNMNSFTQHFQGRMKYNKVQTFAKFAAQTFENNTIGYYNSKSKYCHYSKEHLSIYKYIYIILGTES